MDNKDLLNYRCPTVDCNKLLAKCSVFSVVEGKCKSCKTMSMFMQGTAVCSKDLDEKIGITGKQSEETLEFLKNMFGFK